MLRKSDESFCTFTHTQEVPQNTAEEWFLTSDCASLQKKLAIFRDSFVRTRPCCLRVSKTVHAPRHLTAELSAGKLSSLSQRLSGKHYSNSECLGFQWQVIKLRVKEMLYFLFNIWRITETKHDGRGYFS